MALNEKGQEVPDPTPVEVPLRFREKYVSLHEKIAAYVRSEQFKLKAEAEGLETEDEANDFDVEEEETGDLPYSPAEAAMMVAEELDLRKKELLDMEGKRRIIAEERSAEDDRGTKGGQKGTSVVQESREASRGEGKKRGEDVKETE